MELRHNGVVDERMLAVLPLSALSYAPRGCYHVERRYGKCVRLQRVRRNSERPHEFPVEPLPSSQARAAKVFAGIIGLLGRKQVCVPKWTGARCVHIPQWMREDKGGRPSGTPGENPLFRRKKTEGGAARESR